MRNKQKGFTLVELLVSFSLVAVIMLFLFQIILLLKDLLISSGIKTELLNRQALISEKINSHLLESRIMSVNKCGANCLTFVYDNGQSDKLEIDKINHTIQFGDYKTQLIEGSEFGDIKVDTHLISLNTEFNNAVLEINIPVKNKLFPDKNYGIDVVYQYNTANSRITNIIFEDNPANFGHVLLVGNEKLTAYNTLIYTDPGYVYYDATGHLVTDGTGVTVENPFTSMSLPYAPGVYDFKYILHDSAGQVTETVIRQVTIREMNYTLSNSKSSYNVLMGDSYTAPASIIRDAYGKTVTPDSNNGLSVTTTNVSTSTAGTYQQVFTLKNKQGTILATYQLPIKVLAKTYNFAYTGGSQTFSAPANGTYKLEVWGAQGGGIGLSANSNSGDGGKGGYSVGQLNLTNGRALYIYVGGYGNSSSTGLASGGYNGGGAAFATSASEPGNGGGGATDIRIISTTLDYRLIVAGGGGGGGEDSGETGGGGGGTNGTSSYPGTQTGTSGGAAYGIGASTPYDGGGGGGGWYGGGTSGGSQTIPTTNSTSDTSATASGGSGWIWTSASSANKPSTYLVSTTYYLSNAYTYAGNTSFTSTTGGTETGHAGHGYARITILSVTN